MKKLAYCSLIIFCLLAASFLVPKPEPLDGRIEYKNSDGSLSFVEIYDKGNLTEKIVYNNGKVMWHIVLKDGKEIVHDFFPG